MVSVKAHVFPEKACDRINIGLETAQAFNLVREKFEEEVIFFSNKLRPGFWQCAEHLPTSRYVLVIFSCCNNGRS